MRHLSSIVSQKQEGQSAIIIIGALVALMAVTALVVDGGNAFAQRRQLQNALDAGSQAGSIQMSLNQKSLKINQEIVRYVQLNGVDPSLINSYYVTVNGSGTKFVERGQTIATCAAANQTPAQCVAATASGRPLYGVTVEGKKQFATFFAGVVGWRQLSVGADSVRPAPTAGGTCHADDLFPIVVDARTFPSVTYYDTDSTALYKLYENKGTSFTNFGYVTWDSDASASHVASFMSGYTTNPKTSGTWSAGDSVTYAVGDLSQNSIKNALNPLLTSTNSPALTVAVYDTKSGSSYHIVGFARMTIVSYTYATVANGGSYINVKFQRFVEATGGPVGGAQCPYFGVPSIVPPGPVPTPGQTSRALIGTVKINKLTPVGNYTQSTAHIPVDVTNVLDISGSMLDNFGTMSKLNAAKTALTNFNNNMSSTLGDKVGLATFPLINSGTTYSFSCTQSGQTTSYYVAEQRSALTSNIAGVNTIINGLSANGGTPIAAGMQQGRLTVLGAGHTAGHPAIIILASDGLANIRLTGRWTGFQGNVYDSPSCNAGAVQDALDQADIAKSDANRDGQPDTTIFTIAVGNDFNPALMQAIASVDTDPAKPHYFRVTDATSMNSIYQQIASRVETIQNENCPPPIQTEAFASSASMVIRNNSTGQSYNVPTTSTGEFVISNISPGTFEVTSATVTVNGFTYNTFTDGLGGPALTSNPTIVVGQNQGQYKIDLFLKTTDPVTCTGS